jgi:hypothetical protein
MSRTTSKSARSRVPAVVVAAVVAPNAGAYRTCAHRTRAMPLWRPRRTATGTCARRTRATRVERSRPPRQAPTRPAPTGATCASWPPAQRAFCSSGSEESSCTPGAPGRFGSPGLLSPRVSGQRPACDSRHRNVRGYSIVTSAYRWKPKDNTLRPPAVSGLRRRLSRGAPACGRTSHVVGVPCSVLIPVE